MLTLDAADVQSRGAGGHLALPLDPAALQALIAHWAGPLGDHPFRAAPPDARYRLVRLLGFDSAMALRDSFRAALAQALETARTDPAAIPAHRLAGLSGIVGFADLGALWTRVDRGDRDALPAALQATGEVLATFCNNPVT